VTTPPFEPAYNKPERPGVWMNFDNTVSIYHVVAPEDDFDAAAQGIFERLREAQQRYPDWPRVLYLDVDGHLDALGRFEPDFVELQQEFLIASLGPFFTALDMPLVSVLNPEPQKNDLPDQLVIRLP
jgi:hypothetical protein